ncbi:hypothetical protein MTR_5g038070 [Medicago truncatula]|uniref:Uncharacterized protein n=1 Tax=Medicago truncatula TaxID=3880 RepID=G7K9P6_MEDTR|nr:hypothetical protein MTR_5g038070 [Medicago truncatula]
MVVFLPPMNDKWVWQKCLGHACWILISKLNKLKFVKGLSDLRYHSNALCGSYHKGKIVKSSFKFENIVTTSRTYRSTWWDLHGFAVPYSLLYNQLGADACVKLGTPALTREKTLL